MIAILGFSTIALFLILIITKRLSVVTALVIVPTVMGLLGGNSLLSMGDMMLDGIKQVAPTGILLIFAVLYFAVMLDAGLFDPVVRVITRVAQGDPLKVAIGTALLTMVVHLDGDGTATFMIVVSAFLPIYRRLKMNPLVLAGIVALSVGPLHLVPWSGTSARAMATLEASADEIFNPNVPAILGGVVWVIMVAYLLGRREQKRLGIVSLAYDHAQEFSEEQQRLRRPTLVWLNAVLTISLIVILMKGWISTPVLFLMAASLALVINYPKLGDQQRVLKRHGANIFMVSSMIFAAGVFSGILAGSGMIAAMASSLVALIPDQHAGWLPMLTAITAMPASLLFTPDAYYFGVVPVLSETAIHYSINPLEIGRAALLGQMTVGFPLSPLTASTFLLVGLCEVDLGDHQRFTFAWAWGTSLFMTLVAWLSGSISI